MLARLTANGTFAEQFGSACTLTGVLEAAGFEPVRVKIEAADPRFTDEHTGRAWYAARRAAMDLVIAAISNSPWADALVLCGRYPQGKDLYDAVLLAEHCTERWSASTGVMQRVSASRGGARPGQAARPLLSVPLDRE
ncbi:hypothetical protein [Kitasatospora azatica]|uniref:hypothetical protein n=1 Tax=Kitasatospora azatica TaxID=58347 RepID=UPI000561A635|nr:hypothetical protein [Kitasatospora azatica]